jgi:hypothetical protein
MLYCYILLLYLGVFPIRHKRGLLLSIWLTLWLSLPGARPFTSFMPGTRHGTRDLPLCTNIGGWNMQIGFFLAGECWGFPRCAALFLQCAGSPQKSGKVKKQSIRKGGQILNVIALKGSRRP